MESWHTFECFLVLVCMYDIRVLCSFQWGTELPEIARYADISANVSCSASVCNMTCPTRTQLIAGFDEPFVSKDTLCVNTQTPPLAASTGGETVLFNASTVNCTIESNIATTEFSVSVWMDVQCSRSCVLLTARNAELRVESNVLKLNTVTIGHTPSGWTHFVMRNNGFVSLLINGILNTKVENANLTLTGSGDKVEFSPQKNLTSGDSIAMADARVYEGVLTDREAKQIHAGNTRPALGPPTSMIAGDNCRCPPSAPSPTTDQYQSKFSTCTNNRGTEISLLNPQSGLPYLAIDGDTNTFWRSGSTTSVRLTLAFENIYQIKQITLTGMDVMPVSIDITLKNDNTQSSTYKFPRDCTTIAGNACSLTNTSTRFSYTFEVYTTASITRSRYIKLLANSVEIQFTGPTAVQYKIAEIDIIARCHCTGNGCTVDGSNYTCSCGSNTQLLNCSGCKKNFYRQKEDLDCTNPCNCNSNGSSPSDGCMEVGGQCDCKGNTKGRTCNTCKELTVNLGQDTNLGCQDCKCKNFSDGSVNLTCSPDRTCTCKSNVENKTGSCMSCIDTFYNIRSVNGCMPCNCGNGKVNNTCNKSTKGQCHCKSGTEGRQCDRCKNGFYDVSASLPEGCKSCGCSTGSESSTCTKEGGQCSCRGEYQTNDNRICEPNITNVEPLYGPEAGGTRITISGQLLLFDKVSIVAVVDNQADDQLIMEASSNQSMVIFQTKEVSSSPKTINIEITWSADKRVHKTIRETFQYKANPVIEQPAQRLLTSFNSGGCSVTITGQHLNSVMRPSFLVHVSTMSTDTEVCTHTDDTKMTCYTPDLRYLYSLNSSETRTLDYGLELDGLRDYRMMMNSRLQVVSDPYVPVNNSVIFRNTFDKEVVVKGSGFLAGCPQSDIRVTIGNSDCPIKSITDTEITCDPLEAFPGQKRIVSLKIYFGLRDYHWGEVKFTNFWNLQEFIYICVGIGCFLLLIGVIIGVIVCIRRRCGHSNSGVQTGFEKDNLPMVESSQRNQRKNEYVDTNPNGTFNQALASDEDEVDHAKLFIEHLQGHVGKLVKTSLVDRSQLKLEHTCLDKGQYIRVVKGTFSSPSYKEPKAVTIKTSIESHQDQNKKSPAWLNEGLFECTRLRDCLNQNVLQLLGIAIDNKHVYVMYPEMKNRTLKQRLVNTKMGPMTETEKLDICAQVAEGMDFLSSEQVVHKDIAARNCMIDAMGVVKVSDASFSWDLYPKEYLCKHNRYLPVRWMAPESLRQPGFYDAKTDVWSFGVLLWEVFADGCLPYVDVRDNMDVQDHVCTANYRLDKPPQCPESLFYLIQDCHNSTSPDRPNFFVIMNQIAEIINPTDSSDNLYENKDFAEQENFYGNVPEQENFYGNVPEQENFYGNVAFHAGRTDMPPIPARSGR